MKFNKTRYGLRFVKTVIGANTWQKVTDHLNKINTSVEEISTSEIEGIANGRITSTTFIDDVVNKELIKSRYLNLSIPEDVEKLYNSVNDASMDNIEIIEYYGYELINKYHDDKIILAHIFDALTQNCYVASRDNSDNPERFITDINTCTRMLSYVAKLENLADDIIKYEDRTEGARLKAKAVYNQATISMVMFLETGDDLFNTGVSNKKIIEHYTDIMHKQLRTLVDIVATKEHKFSYAISITLPIYEIYKALNNTKKCEKLYKLILDTTKDDDEEVNLSRIKDVKWLIENEANDDVMNYINKLSKLKSAA